MVTLRLVSMVMVSGFPTVLPKNGCKFEISDVI